VQNPEPQTKAQYLSRIAAGLGLLAVAIWMLTTFPAASLLRSMLPPQRDGGRKLTSRRSRGALLHDQV
jgi:hypothetical protein